MSIISRLVRILIATATIALGGCQMKINHNSSAPVSLADSELDNVTAGSAAAKNIMIDRPATSTVASRSASPIFNIPISNFLPPQIIMQGTDTNYRTALDTGVILQANGRRNEIHAQAVSDGSRPAEASAQIFGVGTVFSDILFGFVSVQGFNNNEMNISLEASGPYATVLHDVLRPAGFASVGRRVDIAAISSSYPILLPPHLLVLSGAGIGSATH